MLKESGEFIYPYHRAKLVTQGYTSYKIMMNEYLVRACVIRFLHSKEDFKTINRQMKIDESKGFPKIRELVDLLERYEANRNKYSTMSDFMPVIADYFNTYAALLK